MYKVLVLGLDGGSLDLIKRWKDELPHLKTFLEGGVYGAMETTLPPFTCPAWNCMFTGKNPAKIGLYDFYALSFNEKKMIIVNSTYQDSQFLWEILSKFGIKVGIVNVPNSFPPQKVNGLMICGGLLYPPEASYTYPSVLKEEVDEVVKGYEILPLVDLSVPGKENSYLNEFNRIVSKQASTVKHLMQKYPWNFFVYVIFETDSVQHYFWHHMDQHHPKWNHKISKKYRNVIKDFYRKVDNVLGELIKAAPSETNIIVVSDHGFGPLYGYFCINEWLKEKGYLKTKEADYSVEDVFIKLFMPLTRFIIAHFDRRFVKKLLEVVPKNLLRKEKFSVRGRKRYECDRLLDGIDWPRTKAYGLRMGIFINVKGGNPEGIIEPGEEYERLRNDIIEALYQIRHPETGKRIITHVYKKEQLYSGKHVESAPDLVYVVDNMGYRPIERIDYGRVFIESPLTGDHRLEAMFLAYGPDIKKTGKELAKIKIYDVAPTILHFFGIPIPKDMDGRVLREIFEENSNLAKTPTVYQDIEKRSLKNKEAFTDENEERIKERLRKLGYI